MEPGEADLCGWKLPLRESGRHIHRRCSATPGRPRAAFGLILGLRV